MALVRAFVLQNIILIIVYPATCGCNYMGAGAPAKTKNDSCVSGYIFFREKVRPFPHLVKTVNTTFRRDGRTMGQIKRKWFETIILRNGRGFDYGRWKEKIQV